MVKYKHSKNHNKTGPTVTEQQAEYDVRQSLQMKQTEEYVVWANKWLDGTDRSWEAALVAYRAAKAASDTACTACMAAQLAYRDAYNAFSIATNAINRTTRINKEGENDKV